MIYKGKGKREELSNNRFIHCKDWLARAAEGLVVTDGLKSFLLAGSSIYQVGGQPGHRPDEMVFVLKSLIAKRRKERKQVVLQCYDVAKFFDKEMIEDGVRTCLRRGAGAPAVRLWYKLNQDTRIKVRTAAGVTEEGEVGAVVGQGTIGGALVSQAVLDDAVMDSFLPAGSPVLSAGGSELSAGSSELLQYGTIPVAPLMWVDDMLNPCETLAQARQANSKVNTLLKERGLNLNKEKSVCLIIGTKEQKLKASQALEENPLMCGDNETKEKQDEKWLGQYLSARGLAASVEKTVNAREGKIRAAGREIAAIVEDWRSRAAGGLDTALTLWQACCIPSLLAGCGAWVEMSCAVEKKLNKIQNWFLRLVLQVGPGAPLASLLWDTGLLDMGLLVWREKLMLVLHLRSLDEDSLARRFYEEQKANNWPGLVKEAQEICQKLDIECVTTTGLDAKSYRKVVTVALHKVNKRRLLQQADNKTKCDRIKEEIYGKKAYLKEKNIQNTRFQYKARFKMLPFAGNYGGDRRFLKSEWLCKCGLSNESESHLLSGECHIYRKIRNKYENIDSEDNLIQFFSEVLEERERLEEEEEEEEERQRGGGGGIPSGGGCTMDAASGGPRPPPAGLGAERPS